MGGTISSGRRRRERHLRFFEMYFFCASSFCWNFSGPHTHAAGGNEKENKKTEAIFALYVKKTWQTVAKNKKETKLFT